MSERAAACPGLNALAALLDGRLAGEDEATVLDHLAHCEVCLDLVAETLMVSAPVLVARPVGIAASGAPRSWSRSRVAAVAAAVAAALIAALLVPELGSLPNVQGPKLADLADAAGLGRPVEGRLTGGFTHRPWFAPLAGGQGGAMTSSTAIQLAAGKIRGTLRTEGTATAAAHLRGVAVAAGRLDRGLDGARRRGSRTTQERKVPERRRGALPRAGQEWSATGRSDQGVGRGRAGPPRRSAAAGSVVQPRPRARAALASRAGPSRMGRLSGPRPLVGLGRRGASPHRRARRAGRRLSLASGRGPPSHRCGHGAGRGGDPRPGHRSPHVLRNRPVAGLGGRRARRSPRRRRARRSAHDGRRLPPAHRRRPVSRCGRVNRPRRAARSGGRSRAGGRPRGLCRGGVTGPPGSVQRGGAEADGGACAAGCRWQPVRRAGRPGSRRGAVLQPEAGRRLGTGGPGPRGVARCGLSQSRVAGDLAARAGGVRRGALRRCPRRMGADAGHRRTGRRCGTAGRRARPACEPARLSG